MLIDRNDVKNMLDKHNISIKGILHVGAHECEEMPIYTGWGVDPKDIVWVDANPRLVEKNTQAGIQNCYTAVLDETARSTTFNITNNGQSSSLLDFGTHAQSYPWCVVTDTIHVKTETLTQFYSSRSLDYTKYNFWNFDIQGSEFSVFYGSKHLLQYADCIYTEVNTAEVYKGCGLLHMIDDLLQQYGLTRVILNMTSEKWGDAMYIRTNKAENPYGKMTLAIPTYKRFSTFLEKYLPVYVQMPYFDTILIGDETGEDIEEIKKQPWGSDPKLVLIKNDELLGAYHNKVNLLKKVTTDWVALIDSDNQLLPEYFTGLYKYWDTHGLNTNMVYIPASLVSSDIRYGTQSIPIQCLANTIIDANSWNSFQNTYMSAYGLNVGNCVFPKSACNLFSTSFEKHLMVECITMNKTLVENGYSLVFVPDMKYIHVVHNGSLYLNNEAKMDHVYKSTNWLLDN
jgi:hypothetical protein